MTKKPTTPLFLGATNQHEGKTTCSLGFFSALRHYAKDPGFIKPVGQNHLEIEPNTFVDKDVPLFKEWFSLQDSYQHMSPIIFSRHFSRDYLDKKITADHIKSQIHGAFQELHQKHDRMLIEGTGHMGVGSICDIDNAKVAKLLGAKVVLITSGGIGSLFDKLLLNLLLCKSYGLEVIGVIINKAIKEKIPMIREYIQKALKKFDLPILGIIPYDQKLSFFSMKDLSILFGIPLLSGQENAHRVFFAMRLVATSREIFEKIINFNELIITPSTREDIILATLKAHLEARLRGKPEGIETGFIFTGSVPPSKHILHELHLAKIPSIFTGQNTFHCMKKVTAHTSKLRTDNRDLIEESIKLVKIHVDFDVVMNRLESF